MPQEEMNLLIKVADKRVSDLFYHGRPVSKWVKKYDPIWQTRFAETLEGLKAMVTA